MKVYHGGDKKIESPNLLIGRSFYTTPNEYMAKKWAIRKSYPIINIYDLNISGLKIKQFGLDKEWLDFVVANRNEKLKFNVYSDYDVLIGTTADDKMFSTIENYESGFLSAKDTIAILNNMDVGIQICLKSQKAIDNLKFDKAYAIDYRTVLKLKDEIKKDKQYAEDRTSQMIKKINERKDNSYLDVSNLSKEQIENIKKIIEQEENNKQDDIDIELD